MMMRDDGEIDSVSGYNSDNDSMSSLEDYDEDFSNPFKGETLVVRRALNLQTKEKTSSI